MKAAVSRTMKKSRKRSLAAKRGWTKRRANQARRSSAARKGWKTRRKNQAKRSSAARKGWKTRRKNQVKKKPPIKPLRENNDFDDFDFGEDKDVSP
jgi:hypothetical protein